MIADIPEAWRPALAAAAAKPEAVALAAFLAGEDTAGKVIHPAPAQRFAALELVPPERVRVVILGQDPYHGPGQAMGLSFAVPRGVAPPPSLRNIFRELAEDCGVPLPSHGDLSGWARQGVLLLNTCLSVAEGQAGSHAGRGWEALTAAALDAVAERAEPSVFILWGGHAQQHAARLAALGAGRHLLIESPHPSPLAAWRGFFGSRPFSRANAFLEARGRGTVDWAALG